MHPDFLPTGKPVIGERRSYGELAESERFGIGILGLHEGRTLLVALRASGLCKAVAGCDLSAEKRLNAQIAAPGIQLYEDYAEMLADPNVQIVAIYTPDPFHAEHIEAAFRAGKHVICTKPILNNLDDGERIRKAAKESGMRLQVGQSTRFYEPFQRQRELYEAGAFGEIEVLDAHYNHRMDWWYEKSPWSIEGTHWAYLGLSHPIDLATWYLGRIVEVQAMGSTTSLGTAYGMSSPDAILVNLRSESGNLARILGNYGVHELPQARSIIECWLMGSKGSSVARYPELKFSYHDERGIEIEENYEHAMAGYYYRHELKGMHYGEFCNYADYFASKLLSGEPNSPDLEEGLATLGIMDAVVESLTTSQSVQLNY